MNPENSKKFLTNLMGVGSLWMFLGATLFRNDPVLRASFFEVYLICALDLGLLIGIFWTLFFSKSQGRRKLLMALLFLTFKLVCLGFLAITLKRLEKSSIVAAALAVSFLGAGPMLSALISKVSIKK